MPNKVFFDERCKVCNSPFRSEYEALRKGNLETGEAGYDIGNILKHALNTHSEKFSWAGMQRHMTNHFAHEVTMRTLADEGARAAVSHNIQILRDINNTLDIARTSIRKLVEGGDVTDPVYIRSLTQLMEQFRKIIESAERLQAKLQIKTDLSETEMIQLLVEILGDMAPDVASQALLRAKKKLDEIMAKSETQVAI